MISGMDVDVSDGMGCWSGTVSDISRNGLCLHDLGSVLGKKTGAYTVVASTDGVFFKFRVKPRWEVATDQYKTMGVEIAEAPSRWMEYIRSLESAAKER
jgi:hypothetical protein